MKKNFLILAVSCLAASVMVMAQDEAAYVALMKQIGPTCSALGKKLQAKEGAAAVADAKKLQDLFQEVHAFWQKRSAADAMNFAKEASAAFQSVEQHASGGHFDEASASFKKALATCSGCHNAHREKAPDGSWKIK
ncbi:MAG: hypothetical protein NZV14_06355 [Bryobacteraceae bacterium]|nr:hypothetical protein [Bryobacteraceae bacterium]MDW8377764.1 hypothetical protein [Bryobacterales bacterium]